MLLWQRCCSGACWPYPCSTSSLWRQNPGCQAPVAQGSHCQQHVHNTPWQPWPPSPAHLLIWRGPCSTGWQRLDLELVLRDHLATCLIRQVPLELQARAYTTPHGCGQEVCDLPRCQPACAVQETLLLRLPHQCLCRCVVVVVLLLLQVCMAGQGDGAAQPARVLQAYRTHLEQCAVPACQ